MNQFFDQNNLEKFFNDVDSSKYLPDFKQLFKETNLNPAFDFVGSNSKPGFGPLLSMAGGIQAARIT